MNDHWLEEKIEIAENSWESCKNVPDNNSWCGFYTYGDAPPAIGGGFGQFVWFPDRDQMYDFIENVLPFSPPGESTLNWKEVYMKTKNIVDKMRLNQIDDDSAISELNQTLVTFSQFEWLGTFEDLLTGNGEYVKNVRREFWYEQNEDDESNIDQSVINNSVVDEFKDFISTYGMV